MIEGDDEIDECSLSSPLPTPVLPMLPSRINLPSSNPEKGIEVRASLARLAGGHLCNSTCVPPHMQRGPD